MNPDLDPRWARAIESAGRVQPVPDLDAAWAETVERSDSRTAAARRPRWSRSFAVAAAVLLLLGLGTIVRTRGDRDPSVRTASPGVPDAIAGTVRADGARDWTFGRAEAKDPRSQICFEVRRPSQVTTRCQPVRDIVVRPSSSAVAIDDRTALLVVTVPRGRSATIALTGETPVPLASVPGVHVDEIRIGGNPFAAYSARVRRFRGTWPGSPGSAIQVAFGSDEDIRDRFDARTTKDWHVTVGPAPGDPTATCVNVLRKGGGGGSCGPIGRDTTWSDGPSPSVGCSGPHCSPILAIVAPSDRSVLVGFPGATAVDLASIPGVHRDTATIDGRAYVAYTAVMVDPVTDDSSPVDGLVFTWGPDPRIAPVADRFAPNFPKDWTVSARADGDALCVRIVRAGVGASGRASSEGCSPFPDGHDADIGFGASGFGRPSPNGLTEPISGSAIFSVAVADGHHVRIRRRGSPVSAGVDIASIPGLHADQLEVGGTQVTVYSGVLLDAAPPSGGDLSHFPVELAWG